jgi:3-mercaptopyruvate sulfurtransferase SseA
VAHTLLQHGWTTVRPLQGGFDAWQKAGYPTELKATRTQTVDEVAQNVLDAEGEE